MKKASMKPATKPMMKQKDMMMKQKDMMMKMDKNTCTAKKK